MNHEFAGKAVLVTGASKGIGAGAISDIIADCAVVIGTGMGDLAAAIAPYFERVVALERDALSDAHALLDFQREQRVCWATTGFPAPVAILTNR
jgi:NAD(P)-dependent dehydrogenase (short-subunit alcohol dehydrogenase family)